MHNQQNVAHPLHVFQRLRQTDNTILAHQFAQHYTHHQQH